MGRAQLEYRSAQCWVAVDARCAVHRFRIHPRSICAATGLTYPRWSSILNPWVRR